MLIHARRVNGTVGAACFHFALDIHKIMALCDCRRNTSARGGLEFLRRHPGVASVSVTSVPSASGRCIRRPDPAVA